MSGSSIPTIGDVLMLSQVAWRTGRAFSTPSRNLAPREFVAVEDELNRLTKALKRLAESFFADGTESFVAQTDKTSHDGIAAILLSCRRTLEDLESLTEQYQIVKKTRTLGGYAVERTWSDLVMCNIYGMIWTAEGGNIHILREMLSMHTITVSMLRTVLDRKSVTDIDMGITPVAEKIQEIYQCSPENMSEHLAEIRGLAHATGAEYPSPTSSSPVSRIQSIGKRLSGFSLPPEASSPQDVPKDPEHRPAAPPTPVRTPELLPVDCAYAVQSSPSNQKAEPAKHIPIIIPPRIDSMPVREIPLSPSSQSQGQLSPASVDAPSLPPQPLVRSFTTSVLPATSSDHSFHDSQKPLPHRPASEGESMQLPPPAWCEETASLNPTEKLSLLPTIEPEAVKLSRSTSTMSQKSAFERRLFQNSAILCDLRGTLVEYTAHDNDSPNLKMEEAMKECRICLVRRKHIYADGGIGFSTSIWSFSDDMSVRLQEDLEDGQDIIPYTSFFQNEKVSITFPTRLTFHDVSYGTKPLKIVDTSWLNYYFADEESSRRFQTLLYNRTLARTFKTEKTTRVHEGFSHIIAYQEQMCGIENLRIWHEEDTAGVMAMIHFSAVFRPGYLTFYINNALRPIKVRDEGGKVIKIKGLRIPVPDKGERRASEPDKKKMITAARIEFKNEDEKNAFVMMVKEVQTMMIDIEEG